MELPGLLAVLTRSVRSAIRVSTLLSRCGSPPFYHALPSNQIYRFQQIKAVGKTWHKACLRCTECNTTLDSTKLTDKDGDPFCRNCYGKVCVIWLAFLFNDCLPRYSNSCTGPLGEDTRSLGKQVVEIRLDVEVSLCIYHYSPAVLV